MCLVGNLFPVSEGVDIHAANMELLMTTIVLASSLAPIIKSVIIVCVILVCVIGVLAFAMWLIETYILKGPIPQIIKVIVAVVLFLAIVLWALDHFGGGL